MGIGFKKYLPPVEDLALMGGAGLAMLGGPIAPAILAMMYKGTKGAQREAFDTQQKEVMENEDLAEIGRRAEQGNPMYQGERTMEGQLFGRQAMTAPELMGRVSPEFNMKRGMQEFAPAAPEEYTLKPGESRMRGTETIASLPGEAPAVGARGWFKDRRGKVFQAHENSPGTRVNVQRGEWELATDPNAGPQNGPKIGDTRRLPMGNELVTQEYGPTGWGEIARGAAFPPRQGDSPQDVKLKTMRAEGATIKTALGELRGALKKSTPFDRAAAVSGIRNAGGQALTSAWTNAALMSKGEALFNLGVLNGPDLTVIRNSIPDPSTAGGYLANPGAYEQGISRVEKLIDDRISQFERTFGPTTGAPQGGAAPQGDDPGAREYIGWSESGKRVYVENGQQYEED